MPPYCRLDCGAAALRACSEAGGAAKAAGVGGPRPKARASRVGGKAGVCRPGAEACGIGIPGPTKGAGEAAAVTAATSRVACATSGGAAAKAAGAGPAKAAAAKAATTAESASASAEPAAATKATAATTTETATAATAAHATPAQTLQEDVLPMIMPLVADT